MAYPARRPSFSASGSLRAEHFGPLTISVSRKAFLGGLGALGMSVLAGCAAPDTRRLGSGSISSASPVVSESSEPAPTGDANGSVLLVFFSRAGMNYTTSGPVHTDIGNTAVAAGFIRDALGCDVYEIKAADPYPYDYDETVARSHEEQAADARPAIAGELPDISGYDTLLVGAPVWSSAPPQIMSTLFDALDTSGKTIIPFTTHAGSGMGSAVGAYRELCPGAHVSEDGLALRGETVASSRAEVENWLTSLGLSRMDDGGADGKREDGSRMIAYIEGSEYDVELNGSVGSQIAAMLPQALSMSRFADHEFYAELPEVPSIEGEETTSLIEAGGVYYWEGWNAFVLNYVDWDIAPYEVVRVGTASRELVEYLQDRAPDAFTMDASA